ncbi:hypothetical protein E2C01_033103 [Portunus trituberculatus]|uniref:Uncharacterized protein n=1 Tax=Portunus trituberculatus TaxID=210409 RepID=A0A5B7EZ94_PORTR|nr:hypothetical protein [Portunus trituberculatus]
MRRPIHHSSDHSGKKPGMSRPKLRRRWDEIDASHPLRKLIPVGKYDPSRSAAASQPLVIC